MDHEQVATNAAGEPVFRRAKPDGSDAFYVWRTRTGPVTTHHKDGGAVTRDYTRRHRVYVKNPAECALPAEVAKRNELMSLVKEMSEARVDALIAMVGVFNGHAD